MFCRSIICILLVGGLSANQLAADTAFTYQGELKQNGIPANGPYNMDFSLWSNSVGGSQINLTVTKNGVQVVDGQFAVELDFGANSFNNSGRWLEVEVNGFGEESMIQIASDSSS